MQALLSAGLQTSALSQANQTKCLHTQAPPWQKLAPPKPPMPTRRELRSGDLYPRARKSRLFVYENQSRQKNVARVSHAHHMPAAVTGMINFSQQNCAPPQKFSVRPHKSTTRFIQGMLVALGKSRGPNCGKGGNTERSGSLAKYEFVAPQSQKCWKTNHILHLAHHLLLQVEEVKQAIMPV